MTGEPLHLMHSFGRKCSECGRMTWPGMPGAAPRWTEDEREWAAAPDNCQRTAPQTSGDRSCMTNDPLKSPVVEELGKDFSAPGNAASVSAATPEEPSVGIYKALPSGNVEELAARLEAQSQLAVCPYHPLSPEWLTAPNDQPCRMCGGLPEGPDKCTGADLRIMKEAATRLREQEAEIAEAFELLEHAHDARDRNYDEYLKALDRCQHAERALAAKEAEIERLEGKILLTNERLQAVCEKLGCPAGMHRLDFLEHYAKEPPPLSALPSREEVAVIIDPGLEGFLTDTPSPYCVRSKEALAKADAILSLFPPHRVNGNKDLGPPGNAVKADAATPEALPARKYKALPADIWDLIVRIADADTPLAREVEDRFTTLLARVEELEGATGATAKIRGEKLEISIAISALPQIVSGSCLCNAPPGLWKVTDAEVFAREVCATLNDEREDGTTRVHMMFDKAFDHAIDQGAEGVEACDDAPNTSGPSSRREAARSFEAELAERLNDPEWVAKWNAIEDELRPFETMLHALRAEEGDSVTLLCDNPDFNGQPNNAIECCGAWTGWVERRFTGDTLRAAVLAAYTARLVPTPPTNTMASAVEGGEDGRS